MWWWTQTTGALAAVASGGGGNAGSEVEILALVFAAGPVVKGVMLILLAFSVVSWAIIIAKFQQLRRAQNQTREFLRRFWAAEDLAAVLAEAGQEDGEGAAAPAAVIFREGYWAAQWENPKNPPGPPISREAAVRRALSRALKEQSQRLYGSLTFLATCGNTAPFIGLFGTVWGIMSAFHAIGQKGAASVATVAPGIAEALIATAAGLAAAIPAVVAYNYFLSRSRRLEAELTAFAQELLPLLTVPRPEV
jgi:biopolymer transport protein TolQ